MERQGCWQQLQGPAPDRQPRLDFATSAWGSRLCPCEHCCSRSSLHERGTQTQVGRPGSGSLVASGTTSKGEDTPQPVCAWPPKSGSPPVPWVPEEGEAEEGGGLRPLLPCWHPTQASNLGTKQETAMFNQDSKSGPAVPGQEQMGDTSPARPHLKASSHPETQGHLGQLQAPPPGRPAGSAHPPQLQGPFTPGCSPHW